MLRSPVAQLVEHSAVNQGVVGSSPTGGAKVRYQSKSCMISFSSLMDIC